MEILETYPEHAVGIRAVASHPNEAQADRSADPINSATCTASAHEYRSYTVCDDIDLNRSDGAADVCGPGSEWSADAGCERHLVER